MATFTGTAGADIFAGKTNVADLFLFTPETLTSADAVTGGTGSPIDILRFTAAGTISAAALSRVTQVERVELADGVNVITLPASLIGSSSELTIVGGSGDDRIDAAQATRAVTFLSGAGRDTLLGGSGADSFTFAAGDLDGNDIVDGGGGTDVLTLLPTTGTTAFTRADLAGISGIERIVLGEGQLIELTDRMGSTALGNVVTVKAGLVARIDGSAMTNAGLVVETLSQSVQSLTIIGGQAPNVYRLNNNIGAAVTIVGSGRDTLYANGGTAAQLANISGIETYFATSSVEISNAFAQANAPVLKLTVGDGGVDASGITDPTRSVNVTGYQEHTFRGGAGADVFALPGGNFTAATVVDGGAGFDTLRFRSSAYIVDPVGLAGVTGIERFQLADGGTLTVGDAQLGSDGTLILEGGRYQANRLHASAVTLVESRVMLTGGDLADVLEGGRGNDTLAGGAGSDVASYGGASGGVTVSLNVAGAQQTGAAGNDTLVGIENLTGSAFADVLTGDSGANELRGLAGDDRILGGGGNDTISGGAGNDQIDGGEGIDAASYAEGGAVTVNLAITTAQDTAGAGIDTLVSIESLYGSAFADALYGNAQNNLFLGGGGNDMLQGFAGNDVLRGGEGDDMLVGGAGQDVLDGEAGQDMASYYSATRGVSVRLDTSALQDTVGAGLDQLIGIEQLLGSTFSDILRGNGGANRLAGDAGDDTLIGLGGADRLVGGAGADRFVYYSTFDSGPYSRDTIQDFTAGDLLDLSAIDADQMSPGNEAFVLTDRFTGQAGELSLIWIESQGRTNLLADVNGDREADMIISLIGDVRGLTDWFVL
ncbi:calcium-binding protein [Sphingomonas jatrophae]|uniref:Type I secretion C-terminal target domain (VC_A0849 subclass) n=1 Tax=Sphingomonas jatrophae TaxID=1166337 RepID=A0A1I6K0F2_9SPHN|nr:calcium-binding protein [Sphingomonas jatrophae]SFR84703.1 type I secretion C-terminal target domain (VC_A0849 subclass) [Sphingomonas jatrophae]